jgi:ubiquinone/menaquinone biosynthesis C-methylase UbiE
MARRTAESHAAFFLPLLHKNAKLLDVGCGPGTITRGLAARVAPAEAVGVDRAAAQLEIARTAPGHPQNLRYLDASVYALPFADGYFDAVFGHALFEHLAEPVRAARELRRVLRPGGVIGLCSPDWDGFILAPEEPGLDEALALYRKVQEVNGGNTRAGRKLGEWLGEAGFKDAHMDARLECYPDRPLIGEYLAERLDRTAMDAEELKRAGAQAADAERAAAALRRWQARDGSLFAQAWVSATARK